MSVQNLSLSAGQTASPAVRLNMGQQYWIGEAGVSLLVNFPSGAVGNVTVQVSNDPNANPTNPNPSATPRWNNHDVLASLTASQNDSIVFPLGYVRLIATPGTAGVTAGTVWLDIGQADTSAASS